MDSLTFKYFLENIRMLCLHTPFLLIILFIIIWGYLGLKLVSLSHEARTILKIIKKWRKEDPNVPKFNMLEIYKHILYKEEDFKAFLTLRPEALPHLEKLNNHKKWVKYLLYGEYWNRFCYVLIPIALLIILVAGFFSKK